MADALGVPRVTLYGPTTPENYAPRLATRSHCERQALPCAFATKIACIAKDTTSSPELPWNW
jgi:hypothetical protein